MRDATDEELKLHQQFKDGIVAAKAAAAKLKAIGMRNNDPALTIAAGSVHAALDAAHHDAAAKSMALFSNTTAVIMGPGR